MSEILEKAMEKYNESYKQLEKIEEEHNGVFMIDPKRQKVVFVFKNNN